MEDTGVLESTVVYPDGQIITLNARPTANTPAAPTLAPAPLITLPEPEPELAEGELVARRKRAQFFDLFGREATEEELHFYKDINIL